MDLEILLSNPDQFCAALSYNGSSFPSHLSRLQLQRDGWVPSPHLCGQSSYYWRIRTSWIGEEYRSRNSDSFPTRNSHSILRRLCTNRLHCPRWTKRVPEVGRRSEDTMARTCHPRYPIEVRGSQSDSVRYPSLRESCKRSAWKNLLSTRARVGLRLYVDYTPCLAQQIHRGRRNRRWEQIVHQYDGDGLGLVHVDRWRIIDQVGRCVHDARLRLLSFLSQISVCILSASNMALVRRDGLLAFAFFVLHAVLLLA